MIRWIPMAEIVRLRETNPPYAAALEEHGVRQVDRLAIGSASLRLIVATFDPGRLPRPVAAEAPCGPPPVPAGPRYRDREQEEAICRECPDLEDDTCTSLACGMCAKSALRFRPWENLPRCPAAEWPAVPRGTN